MIVLPAMPPEQTVLAHQASANTLCDTGCVVPTQRVVAKGVHPSCGREHDQIGVRWKFSWLRLAVGPRWP